MAGVASAVALMAPAAATGIEPNPSTPNLTVPGSPAPGQPAPGPDHKKSPDQDGKQGSKPKTGDNSPRYCDHAHNQVCQPGHKDTPDCDLGHGCNPGSGKPGNGAPGGKPGKPGPSDIPDTTPDDTTTPGTTTPNTGTNNAAPAAAVPAGDTNGKTPATSTLPKTGPANPFILIGSGLLMVMAGFGATFLVLRRRVTFKA